MEKGCGFVKPKYMIGFFSALILISLFLSAGYRISYDRVLESRPASEERAADTRSIETDPSAEEDGAAGDAGYYLCELHGFVAVYLEDRKTLYELTDIPAGSLPEEVRQQVAAGKHVRTEEELYGFLENYSS